MSITREEVIWGYRIILGRDPENDDVIAHKMALPSVAHLRAALLTSIEFWNTAGLPMAVLGRHCDVSGNAIDLAASSEQLDAMLANIRREWRRFGEQDAHWSVLTSDQFRAGRIEETAELFYQTGRDHVATMLNPLGRAGLPMSNLGRVMDYGCGVGRLTLALAPLADQVTGIDISPAHLRLAEERARETGIANATFRAIEDVADLDGIGPFDLIVSFIVLQHNPPPIIAMILRKLLNALAPGGSALLQIPTYITGQIFSAEDYLSKSQPEMEMNALPQHEVFAIVGEAGCRMLEVREDAFVSPDGGLSMTFAITRPAAA